MLPSLEAIRQDIAFGKRKQEPKDYDEATGIAVKLGRV